MSAWISWGQLALLGLTSDIAGAFLLAVSFMTKNPARLAREIPLHGMTFGLPRLGKSLIRQRVEAQVGVVYLVSGFALQAIVYYTAHGTAAVIGWREDLVGFVSIAALLVSAAVLYMWWVPKRSRALWNGTWRLDHEGKPLDGEKLAEAERAFGPGGPWGDL